MKMLFITITLVGLSAGVFFAWSCSVLPGLKLLAPREYILAFQSMNRAIQNPVFLLCFLGAGVALALATWMYRGDSVRCGLLLAASVLYIVGVLGVTMAGNVPLNEALDKFDVGAATSEQMARQRELFEGAWMRLHNWRSVAAVVSFALSVLAGSLGR
ncbi:MAG TPA: anthrone oxygenase family protein [Puia sp.]|nr:anthrone oxygenase family protein [Puia sp.]